MPYFAIFIGLALFSLYDIERLEVHDKMFRIIGYILAVVILILFSGTAFGLHVDYKMYESGYKALVNINDTLKNFNVDNGFKTVIILFKSLNVSFYVFYLIWGAIILVLIANSINKYLQYPLVGLFMFFSCSFLPLSFQIIRQGFTVAIFLFSLRYVERGEKKMAIFFCILSGFIHSSAWLATPVLLLVDRRGVGIRYGLWTVILLLFIFFRIDTIGGIFHALDGFARRISPFLWGKVSYYVNDSLYGGPVKLSLNFFRVFIVLVIGIVFYERLASTSKYFVIVFNLFFVNYFIMTFFNSVVVLYGRMSFYFQLDYLLLPMYLKIIKGRDRIWPWLALLLYAFGAISTFLHPSGSGWELAYKSWLLQWNE